MAIDLDVHGNTKPLEAAVQAAINRIRRQPIKITVDDKGATQPLGNMKRAADEFSKSMEAANARILAFGASMAIINGVADAFKGMVRNMVEVEKSMADINVVMGLSAQNLDKFGDGLFKVAKETGAAFRVAADAATEYARQGLSMEESLKRTRDALILTRLTGMDSAEAVKSLTAAMNTYGNQIKDTTQLVSKFAAVDVQFAVSAEDFAAAISRTGQAAKSAGVDIDELIGIVTSAQQQTARGGAVIGNALKTIFTKTGRTDTLNQLEDLGIAVRDLEGNTIGAKRILSDLANTFDTLSEAQKAQITQTMGGLFHINILKAVLSDAAKQNGILARATEISSSATDEAVQKNQQLRETMSAMATETGLAIKQVSTQIGEIALAPGMEKILNTVKSLAEGLSGVLGDGEGVGNKFATGFLKGIGNIITGPGLVILTTVFVKLFMTAAKFTKESLSSLIGVTTEAQKQKAIQTSLVALIGQNAALGKEMLRTDISRTEKEKILLGLLKMQTAEAERLNAVSQKLAATLYTRGYGPGLTQGKRRAYGHIPNFADPERAQAAKGGYAAGSIRTMNMPGEGSIVYNSAETVKNFAGFKQPAIMPPQSSKAGKNYQQAFGSIHGFDPYAAGGYIPNFSRYTVLKNSRDKGLLTGVGEEVDLSRWKSSEVDKLIASGNIKKTTLSFTSDLASIPLNLNQIPLTKQKIKDMGVLLGYGKEGPTEPITYSQSFGSLPQEVRKKLLPYMKSIRGRKYGLDKMPDKNSDHWKRKVTATLPTKAVYAVSEDDAERMEKAVGADTLKAALKRSIGSGFDKFSSKIGQKLFGSKSKGTNVLEKHVLPDGSALGALFEAGVRGALNNKALTGAEQQRAFDFMGDNAQRLSENFMGIGKRRFIEAKKDLNAARLGDIPKKVLNAAAKGFVPNFADPLSDAIGREKAAGVPVSQIRVGSHNALVSKGNPLGLGVTNTYDEPNGLRDVFGANGFVPNYAQEFTAGDIHKDAGIRKERQALAKKINEQIQSIDASIYSEEDYRKEIDKIIKKQKKNGKSIELSKAGQDKANKISKRNTQEIQKNTTTKQANTVSKQKNTLATNANTSAQARGAAAARGGRMEGMGSMALMMGLPMIAGYVGGDDPTSRVGGTLSGGLMGASTGASLGMILPGIGTVIGAVAGGIYGMVSGFNDAKEAALEKAKADRAAAEAATRAKDMALAAGLAQAFTGKTAASPLGALGGKIDADTIAASMLASASDPGKEFRFSRYGTTYLDAFDEMSKLEKEVSAVYDEQIDKQRYLLQSSQDEARFDSNQQTKRAEDAGLTRDQINQAISDLETGKKNVGISGKAKVIRSMFGGSETEMFASPDFKEVFGKTNISGKEILDQLKIFESEDQDKIKALWDTLYASLQQQANNQNNYNKAVILRLKKEQAMLSAQDAFNKKMMSASETYSRISNEMDYYTATQGHLMSDIEKASMQYEKALLNATKVYNESISRGGFDRSKALFDMLSGQEYKGEFMQVMQGKGKSIKDFQSYSREEQESIAQEIADNLSEGNTSENSKRYQMIEFLDNQNEAYRILKEKAQSVLDIEEDRAKTQEEIAKELYRQQTGPGAFGRGMEKGFADMNKQVARMDYQLGQQIPYAFADGMANAMTEALNGTKNIKDALTDAAISFLGMIQKAMMQKAAYSIVGAMGFSRGGNVRNYSRGGGVPAMVSNGEYVMGRDAVAKYGGAFMHGLNAGGKIPGYSNGGAPGSALAANFGGGRGYESGRAYQSRAMSGFFYSQSGNVGLSEDTSTIMGILQEEERKRQEAEARRQAKKAKRRQLIGSLVGIVAGAGISKGFNFLGEKGFLGRNIQENVLVNNFVEDLYKGQSRGGPIRKYASGGYISGKSGIDQIPAMLSEGEYVIRASSARQLGKPMLDRINAGKFNAGGAVSELMGSSETASSGGNTNNINISINMERGSGSKKENQSQDNSGQNPADRSSDEQNNAQLAERIKQQVVAVIVEEQRPGGLLSE